MRPAQRDLFTPIANLRLLAPRVSPVDLRVFEDRRTFSPVRHQVRSPGVFSRRDQRRLVDGPALSRDRLPARLQFAVPDKVVLCVRRKRRREVLFATRRTRSGRGRARRRNMWSAVKC